MATICPRSSNTGDALMYQDRPSGVVVSLDWGSLVFHDRLTGQFSHGVARLGQIS